MAKPRKTRHYTGFAGRVYGLMQGESNAFFAEKCGLSSQVVWKILNGAEPTRATIEKIVAATGCDGHWLLTGEGQMLRKTPAENQAGGDAVNLADVREILKSSRNHCLQVDLLAQDAIIGRAPPAEFQRILDKSYFDAAAALLPWLPSDQADRAPGDPAVPGSESTSSP